MKDFTSDLLHFDKRSKEDMHTFRLTGTSSEWLQLMFDLNVADNDGLKPILSIFELICGAETSTTQKTFELEAIECDFSLLAVYLGFEL